MTKEEKLTQAIADFRQTCESLHMKLDELLSAGRNFKYDEKINIENSSAEDIRTILHKLTHTEYLFASFYQRHLNVPNDKKHIDAHVADIISVHNERCENERADTEIRMWEETRNMDEESNDEYESEGEGFCPLCDERPCACSDRDN